MPWRLGRYCRSRRFVFSLVPRSRGMTGRREVERFAAAPSSAADWWSSVRLSTVIVRTSVWLSGDEMPRARSSGVRTR
jgi:hypothetical protein